MSVFKSQYTRALAIIPSENCNIPYPSVIKSGATTGTGTALLIDSEANFNQLGIKSGDIVYNTTSNEGATVIQIVNATTLLLNADIISLTASDYTIYAASPQTTIGNQGCYLYSAGISDVEVITIGGDRIVFKNVQAGQILPVQVLKYISTSDYEFVALW
jgi:hypothetical protein